MTAHDRAMSRLQKEWRRYLSARQQKAEQSAKVNLEMLRAFAAGWTQTEIAAELGLSQPHVSMRIQKAKAFKAQKK